MTEAARDEAVVPEHIEAVEAVEVDEAVDVDEEIVEDGDAGEPAPAAAAWGGPSVRRWVLFAALAIVVVAVDQATKAWLTSQLQPGAGMVVIDGWLNFLHGQNSGMLFGLLPQSAPAFAVVSLGVTVLIVVYHWKAGRGVLATLALGLLLGGAIGNLIDRLVHGYVVDWIDMGIGTARFWTYNVADSAITASILLLILMALVPRTADWGADG
jgi:signal peptidase II